MEHLDRHRRARHLHQAQYAFLHPRAAGRRVDDIRRAIGDCRLDARDERFAHRLSHRSAHKGEILHADHRLAAADRAARIDQRIGLAGRSARRLDAIGIAFRVAEFQGIVRHAWGGELAIATLVERVVEPQLRPDPFVKFAFRADVEVFLQFLGEHHLPAALALVPQVLGRLRLGNEGDRVADAGKPTHASSLCVCRMASARLAT